MKNILVPIDFSRNTKSVVAHALALARLCRSRVVLLNVTRPASILADHAQLEELLEACFARPSGARAEDEWIHGDGLELLGEPVPVILEQAARLEADYIVMGSHGHRTASKKPFGSTAAGVLRGARCPVIMVPAQKVPARVVASLRPKRRALTVTA